MVEPSTSLPLGGFRGGWGWGDGEEQLQPGKDRLLVCPDSHPAGQHTSGQLMQVHDGVVLPL